MSVEGSYNVTLFTPFGPQKSSLTLEVNGSVLGGRIDNPEGASEISSGSVSGNNVEFFARILTPMGHLKAVVRAQVEGSRFSGCVKLPLGSARIEGERTGARY